MLLCDNNQHSGLGCYKAKYCSLLILHLCLCWFTRISLHFLSPWLPACTLHACMSESLLALKTGFWGGGWTTDDGAFKAPRKKTGYNKILHENLIQSWNVPIQTLRQRSITISAVNCTGTDWINRVTRIVHVWITIRIGISASLCFSFWYI